MDRDTLTFTITTNPGFISITDQSQSDDSATATLVIKPGEDIYGIHNATVQVSDGLGGTDSESFTIEVTELQLENYFPIEDGASWSYKVEFPQNCEIKYNPWFEYPDGLISTSFTHGDGSWNAGTIYFEISVNEIYETTSDSKTWDILLSEVGLKFYFYQSNSASTDCRLRLTIENEDADLDLIAVLPIGDPKWIIARSLARLSSADLSEKYNVTVQAGEFEKCVKSVVTFGGYPIETYLAPNVGIIKAVGKDNDETVLYTLELVDDTYNPHDDPPLPQDNKITDYDGNEYDTVVIGSQVWMKENLMAMHYSDGTPIDSVFNHPDGTEIYGRLYHWQAAMKNVTTESAQGACPTGWHIPTYEEFTELVDYLGGEDVAGGKLKATGTLSGGDGLWLAPNTGATNESGFTALPAGWNFMATGGEANFWSSTKSDNDNSYRLELSHDIEGINKLGETGGNNQAISVRCIKD